jgi:hypothetical protein
MGRGTRASVASLRDRRVRAREEAGRQIVDGRNYG